jgi:hypothetical protein
MPSTIELDRLIARSKQITSDLMVVRRELKMFIERPDKFRFRTPDDRVFLVLGNIHDLASDLRELWDKPAREHHPAPEPGDSQTTLTISNGRLWLTPGEKDQ